MWLTKAHTSQEAPTSISGSSSHIPIRIYKSKKICQIIFEELEEIPTDKKQYKNKEDAPYQNEKEFVGPKLDSETQRKVDEIVNYFIDENKNEENLN